jgi:hypothetical protein
VRIVRASWYGTGALTLTAVPAAIWPDRFTAVSVPVALALFAVGCGALLAAYLLAVRRSRHEEIGVAELFFLTGRRVPAPVRTSLRWSLVAQVAVALVTASIRPYSPLAFGILAPAYGLGLMGLWSARHGTFPKRKRRSSRRR